MKNSKLRIENTDMKPSPGVLKAVRPLTLFKPSRCFSFPYLDAVGIFKSLIGIPSAHIRTDKHSYFV